MGLGEVKSDLGFAGPQDVGDVRRLGIDDPDLHLRVALVEAPQQTR